MGHPVRGGDVGFFPTHAAMMLRHEWGTRAPGAGEGKQIPFGNDQKNGKSSVSMKAEVGLHAFEGLAFGLGVEEEDGFASGVHGQGSDSLRKREDRVALTCPMWLLTTSVRLVQANIESWLRRRRSRSWSPNERGLGRSQIRRCTLLSFGSRKRL